MHTHSSPCFVFIETFLLLLYFSVLCIRAFYFTLFYFIHFLHYHRLNRGRRDRCRMVVGFNTYAIVSNVVSSNLTYGEVYSIHHYVIKFVSDLRQIGCFL